MNTTAPSVDVHRRRGFQVVSRLARQKEAPGRHLAEQPAGSSEGGLSPADTYEPRHRQDDLPSFLMSLVVG